MPPTVVRQVMSSAGPCTLVDVNEFAYMLFDANSREIMDKLVSRAIEIEVLGAEPPKYSEVQSVAVQETVWDPPMGGAVFAVGTDPQPEDTIYRTVQFPLKPVGDDILGCIVAQLIELTKPIKDDETNDIIACEKVALQALENFICPTFIVKIKPNVLIAVDPNDFKITIIDDNGIIKLAVHTDKVASLRGLELNHDVDL